LSSDFDERASGGVRSAIVVSVGLSAALPEVVGVIECAAVSGRSVKRRWPSDLPLKDRIER
jgi:cobalamin biosynthesis Mg chelatase CobN